MCWFGHFLLDYEAKKFKDCRTHEYIKTGKFQLPTPSLSPPNMQF